MSLRTQVDVYSVDCTRTMAESRPRGLKGWRSTTSKGAAISSSRDQHTAIISNMSLKGEMTIDTFAQRH